MTQERVMTKVNSKKARRNSAKKSVRFHKVNLTNIAIAAGNLEGQPYVFQTLNDSEKKLVKILAGKYPSWYHKGKILRKKVTAGATGSAKTPKQWAKF